MQLLSSKKSVQKIKNIIHQDTQLHTHRIDLTVDTIHQFTKAGSLDFGGGEFEPAATQLITPKKNESDDYGWWKLWGGIYKAVFNEELDIAEQQLALISPHSHARQAGLVSNSILIASDEPLEFIYNVPECGCNIKENARIATLYWFEIG